MNTQNKENVDVQISSASEILIEPADPRRTTSDELQNLARRIRKRSGVATIRFGYYDKEAGKYGVTWAEIIHIWLPRITDAVEAELVMEIIKIVVKWARKRMRKGSKSPRYINIYSADGKILREIKINDREQNPEIIIPDDSASRFRSKPPIREKAYNDFGYALLLIRNIVKKTLTAIPRSLKYWPTARRIKKHNRAKQRYLELQRDATKAVKVNHELKELALAKILEGYNKTKIILKRNAVYGKVNDTVHFEIVLETEEGRTQKLVHIYCAKEGNIKDGTRLYAEELVEFQVKLEAYLRLENDHRPLVTYVLIVPRKELGKYPDVDMTAFNSVFGYEKWIFGYEDLGYKDGTARHG